MKRKGLDVSKKKEIREYLTELGLFDPEEEERFVAPNLNEELPENLLQHYLDWEYTLHDSPMAQAHHYLLKVTTRCVCAAVGSEDSTQARI